MADIGMPGRPSTRFARVPLGIAVLATGSPDPVPRRTCERGIAAVAAVRLDGPGHAWVREAARFAGP